jgi:DNA processing protein
MLRLWLWLAHRPHISEKGRAALLRHFGDIRVLYEAGEEAYRALPGLRRDALDSLLDKDLSSSEKILDRCRREDIRIVTHQDAAYPNCLRSLDDMPVLLYYKGTLPDFDKQCVVGVSGTRRASSYGLFHARRLGYEMGCCGATVVTGMAAGIDTQATVGALEAGAVTVGVLGCGIDRVYPAANRELYEKVKGRGCILSEYAPGTEPFRWNFPKRNRIITGLSSALLVVEAPEKSGALITAADA